MFSSRRIATLGGSKFKDDWSFLMNSDDSNDSALLGVNLESIIRDSFSVVVWLKSEDTISAGLNAICGLKKDANDWIYLGINAAGQFVYYHVSDGATNNRSSVYTFDDGESPWMQLVFTIEKNATNGCKYYKDGVFIEADNTNSINDSQWAAFDAGSVNFAIGGQRTSTGTSNVFDGYFSEFAIYNKVLSESEVATVYNSREAFNHKDWSGAPNCKGWWRFGDGNEGGSGTTIYDMSGEGNNATLQNSESGDLQGNTP